MALALLTAPRRALASGEGAPAASAAAARAAALPDLPRLPPIVYPEPDAATLRDLDNMLSRLTAEDAGTRNNARTTLGEVTASFVPAIRHRSQDARGSLDRVAAARILEGARKAGRKAMRAKGEHKGGKDKEKDDDDGDWLEFVLAAPQPSDATWQGLVHVLALERMLTTIGTTPAVREIVALEAHLGELLRIDIDRQILKLRDRAVPALIEARQHDAKAVQRWAGKELDILGRAIPGEAVGTNDTDILADVLRAYGRTRDVDAMRVVLSFCNSDRAQLREAAREAVTAIGEPGAWQLKDQYLSLTGNKAPREWSWDRLARELFALYDRARQVEVSKLMDDGVAAAAAGKRLDAVEAFDRVLARSPMFERRREMAPTYVEQATQLEGAHRPEAIAMLRKARLLDPKSPSSKKVDAEIAYLEGVVAVEQGAPDKTAFQRALELDPTHERARAALAELDDSVALRKSQTPHYLAAGGIAAAALLAMALVARAWRKPPAAPAP